MQISEKTMSIMKSFSNINQSLVIKKGNQIRTISPQKTVLATATVDEKFEQEACFYELNQFLSAASLFETPEYAFNGESCEISDGDNRIRIFYASQDLVVTPPNKNLDLDADLSFELSESVLKQTMQSAGVLGAPNWCVVVTDGNVFIEVTDVKNSTSNSYRAKVGTTDTDDATYVFRFDNIKVMAGTYTVDISKKGISKWSNDTLEYYIATETK